MKRTLITIFASVPWVGCGSKSSTPSKTSVFKTESLSSKSQAIPDPESEAQKNIKAAQL